MEQEFKFDNQSGFYRGKVRDVYYIGDRSILMIASDRISAFDVILPKLIPYKGQVLTQIAAYMLEACEDIVPVWLQATPAPMAALGFRCQPYKVEVVVRGYLTGHAWRTYSSGEKWLCGVQLPEGLKENDRFSSAIITPSTKADEGHDEDISAVEIIEKGIVKKVVWEKICEYAFQLFARGQKMATEKGLILVDTKYEFGEYNGEIYLMDEIHTPDSSRYFNLDGYEARQLAGQKQEQLSKEFVREWLITNNFMGREGDNIPDMTDEWVGIISKKYIELYEKLVGEKFEPVNFSQDEIFKNCAAALRLPQE